MIVGSRYGNVKEKSLQINISRIADAEAVIRHLQAIKDAFEAHGCSSIELAIAEEVVTPVTRILTGVFNWTTWYRKIIKPFEGNVMFIFPDPVPPAPKPQPQVLAQPVPDNNFTEPEPPVKEKAPKQNRYLRNLPVEASGKSADLVHPPRAEAT